MCFTPQRRALFSTSQLPKVVRSSSVLSILTWKRASRHNGVHFFMSHLASWLPPLERAYFSTLRSHKSELEKHSVSQLSYLFAHLHLLSSDLFSSDSSHLCFSTVHIVGSFTSKLSSNICARLLETIFRFGTDVYMLHISYHILSKEV